MLGRILGAFCISCALTGCLQPSIEVMEAPASHSSYMHALVTEANTAWPENRQLNLVFHGHSVPAGFFRTPEVRTLQAYPHLTLVGLTSRYKYAQINAIVSAKGGETSIDGEKRFASDVLTHQPDVVVIDYVLNDKDLPTEKTDRAWRSMIRQAQASGAAVLLVTATPDLSANADTRSRISRHSQQIRDIARSTGVGLVDAESAFARMEPDQLPKYMAQENHPNHEGHLLIADQILAWFP